jgi:hypothetical protein
MYAAAALEPGWRQLGNAGAGSDSGETVEAPGVGVCMSVGAARFLGYLEAMKLVDG